MRDEGLRALFALDTDSREPRYRQLASRVRGAIAEGVLRPGDRVPATRWLARELGLARATVGAAYALLAAEGHLDIRRTAGAVVGAAPVPARAPEAPALRPGLPLDAGNAQAPQPLQMGLPALDAFPRKIWARLAARVARATQPCHLVKQQPFGASSLRTAIAAHLCLARGVDCLPAQVFVTSGYRDSLGRIVRVLLAPGSQAWVEDPGYPPTRELLAALGMRPVPVPVDEKGLDVARGIGIAPGAAAAIVTPAHQAPLALALAAARRAALLEWARHVGAWIIEDDYDGELRHVGKPLPALASLNSTGRVLYCGSFSKLLLPGLRLAYLVVPLSLVERFEDDAARHTAGQPQLTQAILSEFIREGHFVRHIQRMRILYAQRRVLLADALRTSCGEKLHVHAQAGGMHLLATTAARSDLALAARLREAGLAPQPLSPWYAGQAPQQGLLMGFANVSDARQAVALAARVRACLAQPLI